MGCSKLHRVSPAEQEETWQSLTTHIQVANNYQISFHIKRFTFKKQHNQENEWKLNTLTQAVVSFLFIFLNFT